MCQTFISAVNKSLANTNIGCSISNVNALKDLISQGWDTNAPIDFKEEKVYKGDKNSFMRLGFELSDDEADSENAFDNSTHSDNYLKNESDLIDFPKQLSSTLLNNIIEKYKNFSEEIPKVEEDPFENPTDAPQVRILKDTENLKDLDANGYRAIWARLSHHEQYGMPTSKNWVRYDEDLKEKSQCDVANEYYQNVMGMIDAEKININFSERDDIAFSILLEKLYTERCRYYDRFHEQANEVLQYVKNIIGERQVESLINLLVLCILKAVRRFRKTILAQIGELVICQKKQEQKKDFKLMMLKPFKGSETAYKKFLKNFMSAMKILVKGTQSLTEVFATLTKNAEQSISEYDFKNFGKILFHGIIYSNPLVQECLNEVDREVPYPPITLSSSYESLSDGETPQKPEMEYH